MGSRPFFSSSWHRVSSLRPRLREHVTVHRHRYRGQVWYVVHDHATGWLHRISPAGSVVVGAMDGKKTVEQLWQLSASELGSGALGQDDLIDLLAQLNAANLLQTEVTPDAAELLSRFRKVRRLRWRQKLLNPMALKFELWQPDKFFERTTPYLSWLFGWFGAFLWLLVVIPAIVLAAKHWPELAETGSALALSPGNLTSMAICYLVTKSMHELGHGYMVKASGGAVHEVGVMFLVFAPVPYVDASAASELRSKWRRALVGAGGMIVEVFLAALALYVWLAVENGIVRTIAFDVMLISGVSTVIFNANPLLRFDGYYILSDLIEIPNLGQRSNKYWGYLYERYFLRAEDYLPFSATNGERAWFAFYAPSAFVYRIGVMLAIALFVASEYLAIGVAIAIWGLVTGLLLPVAKALRHVVSGPHLQRQRLRVVGRTFGAIAAAAMLLFFAPVPAFTLAKGVVWLPDSAFVRAGTSGFVSRVLAGQGEPVVAGDPLIESEEPSLATEIASLQARVDARKGELGAVEFDERGKAILVRRDLEFAEAELKTAKERAHRLLARSRADGTFAMQRPDDLPGRYVREGQVLAYVVPPSARVIRVAIAQDDIELVRTRLSGVRVRLAERLETELKAHIVREVPSGRESARGGTADDTGAGVVESHTRPPDESYDRAFLLDVELDSPMTACAAFGGRAYVRFDLEWEPLGQQMWRRMRQLVLARLSS